MLRCFGWKCTKKDTCIRYREDKADKVEDGAYTTTCFDKKEGKYDLYIKRSQADILRLEAIERAKEDAEDKKRRAEERAKKEEEASKKKKRGRPKKER